MDRGAWWAIACGVANSWTGLSHRAHTHDYNLDIINFHIFKKISKVIGMKDLHEILKKL